MHKFLGLVDKYFMQVKIIMQLQYWPVINRCGLTDLSLRRLGQDPKEKENIKLKENKKPADYPHVYLKASEKECRNLIPIGI